MHSVHWDLDLFSDFLHTTMSVKCIKKIIQQLQQQVKVALESGILLSLFRYFIRISTKLSKEIRRAIIRQMD